MIRHRHKSANVGEVANFARLPFAETPQILPAPRATPATPIAPTAPSPVFGLHSGRGRDSTCRGRARPF